ncbi:MAG: hypothetical protein KKC76_14090 [Proteobacteria bacterium]|nr:hypothetical protein [Pseudomonadota bacterium]MBU4298312.1 hypothetical protein [Pseudomonadota bacterium]MCG2749698.1 hypothetical protein [Desulfobulbaceae bacterium]
MNLQAGIKPLFYVIIEFKPWLLAAITVLVANLASNSLWDTFQIWAELQRGEISPFRILWVGLFFVMVVLLFRQRDKFFPPRTRYLQNEKAQKRKHLVLFLSTVHPDFEKTNGIPEKLHLSYQNISDDLASIKKKRTEEELRWNWEMPLRAINHHLGIIESVTICCSRQSLLQVHLFLNICKRYGQLEKVRFVLLGLHNNRPKLVDSSDFVMDSGEFRQENFVEYTGCDFESFDELTRALLYLIAKNKHFENEIMIDITGGQKPTSIVGASVTFNQKIKAQYIQTGGDNEVLSYDVILAKAEAGSIGL